MGLIHTLAEDLLTEEQREIMVTLERKQVGYMNLGKAREAHGVRAAALLVLHHFIGGRRIDFQATKPDDEP